MTHPVPLETSATMIDRGEYHPKAWQLRLQCASIDLEDCQTLDCEVCPLHSQSNFRNFCTKYLDKGEL